jgi:hypothetical protein
VPRRIKGSLVVPTTREGLALSLCWFLWAACLLAFLWPFTCLPSDDGFDHRFFIGLFALLLEAKVSFSQRKLVFQARQRQKPTRV